MGRCARSFSLALAALLSGGCAATKLPLCPKVAQWSYPVGTQPSDINRFVSDRARERQLRITPLSRFTAEVSGFAWNVRWLEKHYVTLVCAFDPGQVIDDGRVYGACMSTASEWIRVVQSAHPEHLLVEQTLFKETCAFEPADDGNRDR